MTDDLRTRVTFATYRDELVPGWPETYRRLTRAGTCPESSVEFQCGAGEVVFIVDGFEPVSLQAHAVALMPEPTIVPIPE